MASVRSASILSDFCLDRLFDPEELYYVPMEELIKRYKKRDLMPSKFYNIAQRYRNGPDIRHRIITAPPMEKLHHRYLDSSTYHKAAPRVYYCTKPNLKDESVITHEEEKSLETEKLEEHGAWLEKRKKLRNDLENMDMNLEYLKRKKDLTELEKRVLRRMMFTDEETQTDEIKEKRIPRNKYAPKPKILLPTPIAMEKIEEALDEKKWRLVDFFKSLDKNKDGKLQEADFRRECKNLGITDAMLDELLMAYGSDQKKLNYKVLAKGRNSLLSDKRSFIKESSSNFSYTASELSKPKESMIKFKDSDTISKLEDASITAPKILSNSKTQITPTESTNKAKVKPEKFIAESVVSEVVPPSRQDSIFSKASSDSNGYLKVPSIDSREDFYPPVTTTNRGTSAPVFYSIKYARPATSKNKKDKTSIPDMIAEFREKVKIDTEELKKARYSIDLNEEQLRAFEYPKESDKSAIIAGILDKKRKAQEKKLYDEKQAWIRKRLRMKMKLRNKI